jgi:flavin reductase (DIM6/NTAB) family NADH-FMN oxidoreductase RutF
MDSAASVHAIDPWRFRQVMGRFATGVTVILARADGETRGMTANAFMSGSLDPPLCVISIARRARMHAHLSTGRCFSVNVLAAGQERYASHFSGLGSPGLTVALATLAGAPTLADASATIAADLVGAHECGDHTIFIGHIREMIADARPPLLFHAGHYAALAPTPASAAPVPEFW